MAARGANAKAEIAKKILETFQGSFAVDKEIRIPIVENGETIQIKVTLTAAKENIEPVGVVVTDETNSADVANATVAKYSEPTEQEVEDMQNMMRRLGL